MADDAPQPVPTARELIDAFVHAPMLLPIGERFDGDPVVVVSHVEAWPWRVVVRGAVANERFEPEPAPSASATPTAGFDPTLVDGAVSVAILEPAERHERRWRRELAWMDAWALADDVGTVYRAIEWSGSPDPDQLWCDLAMVYTPAIPPTARHLVIAGPGVGPVVVDLPA